jgi:hypothetical protein
MVEPTDTHRKQKQTNGGNDRHSLKTKTNQQWNRQTLIENKNKPTVEPTDTHRKQKQTNGGTDRHS